MNADPHARTATLSAGLAPEAAALTLVMIHGRGGSAEDILSLLPALQLPEGKVAAVAPEAADQTWYPYSFLAPMAQNQPFLDSALARIAALVDGLLGRGVASHKIALLGFSQGACLASEFIARHPRRYAGLIAFSGGLIGPPGTPRTYAGSLDRTPAFLGCSDIDPHIPWPRVEETAATFTRMGAGVDLRRYPGMPHTINQDEIAGASALLRASLADGLLRGPAPGR